VKLDTHASFKISRRQLLIHSTATIIASSLSPIVHATSNQALPRDSKKLLSFRNLHTNETLSASYWENGQYNFSELEKINYILRDHRTHEIAAIDHQLLDMLHRLHSLTNSNSPFEIISGFRSEKTNQALRKSTTGVAKRSYHMQGKAIDVRLADVELKTLRDKAIGLNSGGIGYYRKSGFLHIDTGRPRNW